MSIKTVLRKHGFQVVSRVTLEPFNSAALVWYFVFQIDTKDYSTWRARVNRALKKQDLTVEIHDSGMLTDNIAVVSASIRYSWSTRNIELEEDARRQQHEKLNIEPILSEVKEFLVKSKLVKRGLAIDDSPYSFGNLVRDFIDDAREKAEDPKRWAWQQAHKWGVEFTHSWDKR
jgi:hypothetical protein